MKNRARRSNPHSPQAVVAFLLSCLVMAGCGPTYRSADMESSIRKLCNEQYKKDVSVRIIGNTARINTSFEKLFDLKTLGISKEAADRIDDILLAIHRVTLSSDKPIDFYVFIASSNEIPGAQVTVIRYIDDSKRLLMGDISRGEYFNRMIINADVNPHTIAEEKVKEMFASLASYRGMDEILKDYFAKNITSQDMSVEFLTLISERWLKTNLKYEILDIKSKKEDAPHIALYCKVREDYLPNPIYQSPLPVYPQGSVLEFIMNISISGLSGVIDKIIPLNKIVGGKLVAINAPSVYSDYLTWHNEDKFAGDIKLSDFLAEQIARRIKSQLSQDKDIDKFYEIKGTEGSCSGGIFIFSLDLKEKQDEKLNSEKKPGEEYIFGSSLKLASEILRRYEFKDFQKVIFINKLTGNTRIVVKEDALKRR